MEKNAKAGELQELEVGELKAQLADAAKKAQSEMADGKLAVVTLEKQLVASRGQVADLGKQLATALLGVEEGERATVREKQSGEKLEAELTKLKAEYQQAMGKMSSGNADIAKMAARSQKLEDELTAAQKLLGARDKAVAGMQKEVVRLNALAARLGQKAEQSGSTIENLEKEFIASQDGMRALAQERDQLKAENASLVEAANEQQLNATSLDNELAEQASVSALMADWALALTEDFVNQSSEVPVVVADDKKLKAALASQTELASSRSDEVKELRQQLVAAKVSLNQSEMSLRNFEKSLAVQVAGFREKEDTLRANVEKALSLKKVVEGQLAEANGQLAEQGRMLEGQKASVSEVVEELEASLGWVDLLAAELEGQVSFTEQQGRQHVEELNALKGQMEAQTKGFSGNATAMQKDLDKANALLKLSEDQRAKTEKVSAALQKSNKDLSTDFEGVRKELALATQMSSQQGDEIGELMQRSKAQAAELENKNTEIQDGKAKFKQLGDDFRRAMNEADTEGKVNAKEIAALEAKLVVARQEVIAAEAALQAPRQLPEAVENELQLVSALELLVDDLAHELTTGAERDVTLDQPSKQSQELQALQKQLVVETDRSKAMSVELQAARQTLDKANLSIAELKEANSALEKQSEVLVAGATAPLRKELLVVRAQKEELKQKLADYDKDNKHLASELKSLEDNLLTTLSQQDKNEKLSKQKVANLQADLEHARKALNVMKASFAAAPDKSTLEDFEKKAALAQVYEQQVKDIQKKYAGLLEQNAKESGDLQKQLNLMRDKYKIAEADRKVQAATVEEQAEQIVQWGTQASELSERLKVASVPDDTLVSDLQNQLKIANDNGTLLRGRLKGLEEEKIELSEQLVLVQADLGRNKQFFAEMQTRVEALDRLQPGVAIQKQLDGVRKELAGHKKAGLARLEKLKGLEDELAQTRKALEGKEASEAEFAKAYQGKLVGIIQQSHQLQQALQGARADLLKTRTEKNDALVELAQKHAASQKQVQDLQERLAQVQDQLAIRPAASSRERELLMEAMERLGKSKSTIEALGASLSATQTQNRQFAINQAQLLAQLEQAPVRAPSGPDQARVNELELALQESQTKLAQRDRDFRDIVAKMNRVLERLQLPYAPSNP